MVWFGMVWFGLVWDNIHPKLLWKFHQNPTCFDWFREDLKLSVGWGGVGLGWCLATIQLSPKRAKQFKIIYPLNLQCFLEDPIIYSPKIKDLVLSWQSRSCDVNTTTIFSPEREVGFMLSRRAFLSAENMFDIALFIFWKSRFLEEKLYLVLTIP